MPKIFKSIFCALSSARAKAIYAISLAVVIASAAIAAPVYAWITLSKGASVYAPISAPESLYIGTGNGEDIKYLFFNGINLSSAGYAEYIICINGEGIASYGLQFGYTTNNPLTYSIYAAEQVTSGPIPSSAVTYVSSDPTVADTYYVKTTGSPMSVSMVNAPLSTTYGSYQYVNSSATPVYWKTASSIPANETGAAFTHYYILQISWTHGQNNRETDIVCISAKVGGY